MSFVSFMSSSAGRVARIVVGALLIVVGLAVVGGTGGIVMAVVGALPLASGLLNICFLSALVGQPLKGN
jgi:Protein of unknown function (DUF2892)